MIMQFLTALFNILVKGTNKVSVFCIWLVIDQYSDISSNPVLAEHSVTSNIIITKQEGFEETKHSSGNMDFARTKFYEEFKK